MKRLLLLGVVMSATAMAQTAPLNSLSIRLPTDLSKDSYVYGGGECGNTITVSWNNTTTNYFYNLQCAMNPLRLWATAGTCNDTPGTDDFPFDEVALNTVATLKTGTFAIRIADLPGHKAVAGSDGGTVIGCPSSVPVTKTQYICGSIAYSTASTIGGCGTTQYARVTPFKFIYDTEPPSAPSIVSTNAQDGAATVEFSVDSDTEDVTIEVKGPNDTDFAAAGSAVVANTKTVRATGLTNSVTYQVRLRGVDGAGNVSDPSDAVEVTPILTNGLLGYYAAQNGELEGGCNASSVGLMPLLFAAWALRSRFRRNKGSSSR